MALQAIAALCQPVAMRDDFHTQELRRLSVATLNELSGSRCGRTAGGSVFAHRRELVLPGVQPALKSLKVTAAELEAERDRSWPE